VVIVNIFFVPFVAVHQLCHLMRYVVFVIF